MGFTTKRANGNVLLGYTNLALGATIVETDPMRRKVSGWKRQGARVALAGIAVILVGLVLMTLQEDTFTLVEDPDTGELVVFPYRQTSRWALAVGVWLIIGGSICVVAGGVSFLYYGRDLRRTDSK